MHHLLNREPLIYTEYHCAGYLLAGRLLLASTNVHVVHLKHLLSLMYRSSQLPTLQEKSGRNLSNHEMNESLNPRGESGTFRAENDTSGESGILKFSLEFSLRQNPGGACHGF